MSIQTAISSLGFSVEECMALGFVGLRRSGLGLEGGNCEPLNTKPSFSEVLLACDLRDSGRTLRSGVEGLGFRV